MTNQHDDRRSFEQLLADLRTGDLFTRVETAEALGKSGDARAFDPLIAALRDPEWRGSMAAVSALGALGDDRAVGPIAETLRQDKLIHESSQRAISIANTVIPALKKLGEPGFQALLTVLREFVKDEIIGGTAASVLGEMRDPRALDTLLYALHSSEVEVGSVARMALSKLGEIAILPLIAVLREPLNEPPNEAHYLAQQALRAIGPTTIPYLLDVLATANNSSTHALLLRSLSFYDDERVLGSLRAAISDTDVDVREAAAFALARHGELAALEHVVMTPQRIAGTNMSARALAQIGVPAVDPLILALSDPDRPEFARINAATALGEIGDMRAVEPLIAALRDEMPAIRLAAAQALGHLKHPQSVEALLAALDDDIPEVRRSTILALGALGGDGVFEALARIATDPSSDARLRMMAALALGRADQERAVPILMSLLAEEKVGRMLAPALSQFREAMGPALLEAAQGDNQTLRFNALQSLRLPLKRERDERIVGLLATLLDDDDPGIRHAAARMLGEIGDARAVDALVEALGHWNISERISAAQHLEKMGDARALPALEKALADGLNTGAAYSNTAPSFEGEAHDAFQRAILSIRARMKETDKEKL